jgi:hypothetical protein
LALLGGDVRSETVNVMQRRATALLDIIEMMNQIAGYKIGVRANPQFAGGGAPILASHLNLRFIQRS